VILARESTPEGVLQALLIRSSVDLQVFVRWERMNIRRHLVLAIGLLLSLVGTLFSPLAAAVTSIDEVNMCAGGSAVEFDVVITNTNTVDERVRFRIGADSTPFSTPTERFAVNYSAVDGSILDQPPELQTFGTPPFDRWQDGPVTDFSATNEGVGRWRLQATLPHGTEPFNPGDEVWGIAVRADNNLFQLDVLLEPCDPVPLQISVPEIQSHAAPVLDGELSLGEWTKANRLVVEHGFIGFLHDRDRLYVLIDVLADTGDDPIVASGGDQFWLCFDVNQDGVATPDTDLCFRQESGTGNLRYHTFCDDCLFGFNNLEPQTFSARAEGFGCYLEDGSRNLEFTSEGLQLNCSNHRVWELAIDLREIGVSDTTATARLGYLIASGTPLFSESHPTNLLDVDRYVILELEGPTRRTISPGNFDGALFEVTQAIQTEDNVLDLAAGKPTAVRIWDPSLNETPVRGFIYGQRNGVDLPGSPILRVGTLASQYADLQRDSVASNITRSLPDSWTAGTVDFDVTIQGLDGSIAAQRDASINFVPTRTPLFWTVPVRLNDTSTNTFLDVAERSITASEQALRRIAPLTDISIVRRPRIELDDITTNAALKEELRTYDQQMILAWTIGLLLQGESPFDLPEQITGFTGRSLGDAGGSSDPAWHNNGAARISWIAPDNNSGLSYGYIHELNHNLDTDPTGTWGRHATGCDAGGVDGNWPYGSDSTIQEVGMIRNMTQFNSVDPATPDYMTYCQVASNPVVWTSPYRWSAWLDHFRTDGLTSVGVMSASTTLSASTDSLASIEALAIEDPEETFYISGRVYPDGSGEIGRVLRQPGIPQPGAHGGDYRLQILDCDGNELSGLDLDLGFVDPEGVEDEFASYTAVLPAGSEACAINLLMNDATIASQTISANPPVVTLMVPNGGESWDGTQMVSWQATDPDGDSLQFTLLYSPDGGSTWLPVVTGLTGNEFALDTTTLPGSNDALLRVLASDGGHTATDDSDATFSVADKPPQLSIIAPADQSVVPANEPVVLNGVSRDTFGQATDAAELVWFVDGELAGTGSEISVRLVEGSHLIELRSTAHGAADVSVSVEVTAVTTAAVTDPADTGNPSVDIARAMAVNDTHRYQCSIDLRTGAHGLDSGSRIECHIDFGDFESEFESGCDADGNGMLDGTYQLGTNGSCSVSDMSLNYRHMRHGGECTGGPGVSCRLEETSASGMTDGDCDGEVAGQPAEFCRVVLSIPLEIVAAERDAQCGDGENECFGGVDPVWNTYSAHTWFNAQLRNDFDRAPDTDDGREPNSTDEVILIQLTK
jgi:hypothetical protein